MTIAAKKPTPSWRSVLPVHPAAEIFPLMSPDELRALGEDIKKNGQQSPIMLDLEKSTNGPRVYSLVDGRNRLDAMEMVGLKVVDRTGRIGRPGLSLSLLVSVRFLSDLEESINPYAYVVSANIYRRHLSAEQKRDLIAKLLKATPEKSNRQIAEMVKASHVTVGAERAELESTGQIDQLKKTVGKDGKARKQPAKKKRRTENELPPNDVEAAENAAAQFLYELEDLDEEFERITVEMTALARRLYASLDMRKGETVAEFIRRLDPERPFESDKPQALIAGIACALDMHWSNVADLRSTIKYLNHVLAGVLEKRSPAPPVAPPPVDDPFDIPPDLRRVRP